LVFRQGRAYLYPNYLNLRVSVGIKSYFDKALIENNGYSLVKINNAA